MTDRDDAELARRIDECEHPVWFVSRVHGRTCGVCMAPLVEPTEASAVRCDWPDCAGRPADAELVAMLGALRGLRIHRVPCQQMRAQALRATYPNHTDRIGPA